MVNQLKGKLPHLNRPHVEGPVRRRAGRSRLIVRGGRIQVEPTSETILRMLRQRAEDGQIHIGDPHVEGYIHDALKRILGEPAEGGKE